MGFSSLVQTGGCARNTVYYGPCYTKKELDDCNRHEAAGPLVHLPPCVNDLLRDTPEGHMTEARQEPLALAMRACPFCIVASVIGALSMLGYSQSGRSASSVGTTSSPDCTRCVLWGFSQSRLGHYALEVSWEFLVELVDMFACCLGCRPVTWPAGMQAIPSACWPASGLAGWPTRQPAS